MEKGTVDVSSQVAEVSQEVGRLMRATHAIRAQLGTRSGEAVEWSAFALLAHLVREGPRRSADLAVLACVDPSTVSRQVAQLVALDLVERQADPADGRATLLVATAAGRQTYDSMFRRREQAFANLLAGWSPDDVATLATLLHRLNESFLDRRAEVLELVARPDTDMTTSETR